MSELFMVETLKIIYGTHADRPGSDGTDGTDGTDERCLAFSWCLFLFSLHLSLCLSFVSLGSFQRRPSSLLLLPCSWFPAPASFPALPPPLAPHNPTPPRQSTHASTHSPTFLLLSRRYLLSVPTLQQHLVTMSSEGKLTNVDKLIKENPAIVFSATYCPYCTKAKSVLQSTGAKVKIIEVNVVSNGKEIREGLLKKTGRTSVPAVFVGGEFIGGCNDGPGVVPLHSQGKLVPMLKKAKAL